VIGARAVILVPRPELDQISNRPPIKWILSRMLIRPSAGTLYGTTEEQGPQVRQTGPGYAPRAHPPLVGARPGGRLRPHRTRPNVGGSARHRLAHPRLVPNRVTATHALAFPGPQTVVPSQPCGPSMDSPTPMHQAVPTPRRPPTGSPTPPHPPAARPSPISPRSENPNQSGNPGTGISTARNDAR
jgi:hypothetical protein